eukprot:1112890-Pyramimonas_sp.AAC.1
MGPGPRRLLRWCAGACAAKDPLTKRDESEFEDAHDRLFQHFVKRFGIHGVVQVCHSLRPVSAAAPMSLPTRVLGAIQSDCRVWQSSADSG